MLRFAAGSERKLRGVRDGAAMGLDGRAPEQGFVLVGLIVAIFFILLALSIAAPTVAKELKRERELETIHRGNQYVRAIQLYYKKSGGYPASMELLGKSNNVRYLRQQYVDPMTGKADWRLIHIGEAKTTVKGFFGKALPGMAPGLGTAAGRVLSAEPTLAPRQRPPSDRLPQGIPPAPVRRGRPRWVPARLVRIRPGRVRRRDRRRVERHRRERIVRERADRE
jgi:type II secretory pathway pseudopilin PulG